MTICAFVVVRSCRGSPAVFALAGGRVLVHLLEWPCGLRGATCHLIISGHIVLPMQGNNYDY